MLGPKSWHYAAVCWISRRSLIFTSKGHKRLWKHQWHPLRQLQCHIGQTHPALDNCIWVENCLGNYFFLRLGFFFGFRFGEVFLSFSLVFRYFPYSSLFSIGFPFFNMVFLHFLHFLCFCHWCSLFFCWFSCILLTFFCLPLAFLAFPLACPACSSLFDICSWIFLALLFVICPPSFSLVVHVVH